MYIHSCEHGFGNTNLAGSKDFKPQIITSLGSHECICSLVFWFPSLQRNLDYLWLCMRVAEQVLVWKLVKLIPRPLLIFLEELRVRI